MAEDYDVTEEDREEEVKLRKSKIYCRFIIYIMTSIYSTRSQQWHILEIDRAACKTRILKI